MYIITRLWLHDSITCNNDSQTLKLFPDGVWYLLFYLERYVCNLEWIHTAILVDSFIIGRLGRIKD